MTGAPKNGPRNAEIIRRREAGQWPTEIAKVMGLTRNTVIGVLNRAGLSDPNVDKSLLGKLFCKPLRGENHPRAKLSLSEVRAIRREYVPHSRDFSMPALARKYGVTYGAIWGVLSGHTWGDFI